MSKTSLPRVKVVFDATTGEYFLSTNGEAEPHLALVALRKTAADDGWEIHSKLQRILGSYRVLVVKAHSETEK